MDTLNAIASEPDASNIFYVATFQDLLDYIDEIVTAVKQAGLAGTLYDIEVFIPDGTVIRDRALLTLEGDMVIISFQEI